MEETKKNVLGDCFTSAMALTESGVPHVPTRYILPLSQRPVLSPSIGAGSIDLPVIDLSLLHDPLRRHSVIHEIEMACKGFGFFQVTNHGISSSVKMR
ncbi:unnamed protein product [Eruca vesicaria subsp. sativa]|uniref:Non-haem dioxygenase N-terminal domain-containing protein n=1 Tax=Eruca vesicaria subsp. sativa TaxID=29727 RepID=A0ABC8J682_ERUVS|nr:unnamed protein product [Eruca vesicaria subsp. sativa]